MKVLADANVLYSRTLLDWFGLLQGSDEQQVYHAYWTEDLLAEALFHLRRDKPALDGGQISSIRDKIEKAFEGGRVDDFVIDDSFPGKDVNDRHVHAAAVTCQADIVLTCDEGFHSEQVADLLPYEVHKPDEFFVLVHDIAPEIVWQATLKQTRYWVGRGKRADLFDRLVKAGCPEFAARVQVHQSRLSLPHDTTRP
ncbi:PIN domain-containing protein [Actinosynnema mirum]|uniref:PIN domain-containing protein n=1 Tax=Actinosynnema mirum (strain ATCC 29888 / DSM 43827 / JCM 3225 / NBRC 14064 / NCIMB 13271 / NRRL B-12336 / IMRU 3971 / 101) TaxID=446462 RepID=C6WDQ2_ACTMD|nr:PIN domain-containing protein [Actinosynnema mirum]ACU34047.1 hypothetical protein Amir_0073 [Actinosynnema mirum DSM 43827]